MSDDGCAGPIVATVTGFPSSWYPFCRATDLRAGAVRAITALGTTWAAFRTTEGNPGVMHARCPHFGSDLSAGRVELGGLRCRLHGWRFAPDGTCSGPGRAAVALPVVERAGIVFARLGAAAEPIPPLPVTDLVWCRVFSAELATDWRLVAVNAFDVQHLPVVHRRDLVGPVWHGRRGTGYAIAYRAKVAGVDWHDRLTRLVGIPEVELDVTCWGGNLLVFDHRRTGAATVVALLPLGPERSRIFIVTGRTPSSGGLLARLSDRVLAGVLQRGVLGFMREDEASTTGAGWDPSGLVAPGDAPAIAWAQWCAALPIAGLVTSGPVRGCPDHGSLA